MSTFSQYISFSRYQPFPCYKAIYTAIPQFHHVSHIVFLAIRIRKIKNLFFWHFGHKLCPKSEWKSQTGLSQTNRILSNLCSHIFPLDAYRWFFTTIHCIMYGSNHLISRGVQRICQKKTQTIHTNLQNRLFLQLYQITCGSLQIFCGGLSSITKVKPVTNALGWFISQWNETSTPETKEIDANDKYNSQQFLIDWNFRMCTLISEKMDSNRPTSKVQPGLRGNFSQLTKSRIVAKPSVTLPPPPICTFPKHLSHFTWGPTLSVWLGLRQAFKSYCIHKFSATTKKSILSTVFIQNYLKVVMKSWVSQKLGKAQQRGRVQG